MNGGGRFHSLDDPDNKIETLGQMELFDEEEAEDLLLPKAETLSWLDLVMASIME